MQRFMGERVATPLELQAMNTWAEIVATQLETSCLHLITCIIYKTNSFVRLFYDLINSKSFFKNCSA